MKELNIEAKVSNIDKVTEFVDSELQKAGCPMKAQLQIDVAIDELFSNISNYAYDPLIGPATVRVEIAENPLAVIITFIDNGTPFNPLESKEPDITQSADKRIAGGLGIYIVKKSRDAISYEYKEGKNILTIIKKM